jgi:hypothetical protein
MSSKMRIKANTLNRVVNDLYGIIPTPIALLTKNR